MQQHLSALWVCVVMRAQHLLVQAQGACHTCLGILVLTALFCSCSIVAMAVLPVDELCICMTLPGIPCHAHLARICAGHMVLVILTLM